MNNNQSNKTKFILSILIILIIIAGYAGYIAYRHSQFRITGYVPSLTGMSTVTPDLQINFNRTLTNNLKITMSPDVLTNYKVQNSSIELYFAIPLVESRQYTVTINNVADTQNKTLTNQSFSFTPQQVGSAWLTNSQKALIRSEEDQYNQAQANSLIQLLPFTGHNFEYQIGYTYLYIDNTVQPEIQIYTTTSQGRQDALSWISSQGYNVSKLDIVYINKQP